MIHINDPKKKKVFWFSIIFLYVFTLTGLLTTFRIFDRFDNAVFDGFTRMTRGAVKPSPKVQVILIDDSSLQLLSPAIGRWPWPRAIYKDIIEFINLGNPRGIYFDILFAEEERDAASQSIFARAMQQAGNVHLGAHFIPGDKGTTVDPLPEGLAERHALNIKLKDNPSPEHYCSYLVPVKELREVSKTLPVYTFTSDQDGVFRRAKLFYRYGGYYFPSFTLSALMASAGVDAVEIIPGDNLRIGSYRIPLDRDGSVLLNWYPQGFEPISAGAVIGSVQALKNGDIGGMLVDPAVFEDAVVIIGASAVALHDLKATPISPNLPACDFHATLISNVLNNDIMRTAGIPLVLVAVLMLTIVTAYAVLFCETFVLKYLLGFIVATGYVLAARELFTINLFLPVVPVLFAGVMAYGMSLAYISLTETREKLRIKKTFFKYLSPVVINEMLDRYDELTPEVGKKIDATILFSDIRSFTTISENYPVEFVVNILNEYFETMITEIHDRLGTLDKMIGDAIMAFWNAPVPDPDHPRNAIRTAFAMQSMMKELNVHWKEQGYPTIKIGIGINTGEVIIGNIGARSRLDYTAIGDNVNLASRLEGLCKVYHADMVISEFTYARIADEYPCRILDKVRVKGKQKPISIYEPLREEEREMVREWERFFAAYLDGDWTVAERLLDEFLCAHPHDLKAKLYRSRIDHLKENPVENWDGVMTLESK